MDSSPHSETPPLPASDPEPPVSQVESSLWRKILWLVLAVVVVAPLVWLPGSFFTAYSFHRFRVRPDLEMTLILLLPLSLVIPITFGVALLGLRRGWHLRTALLWGWSIAAVCIGAPTVLIVQAAVTVERSSQDKAVLGNIGQLSAVANQYYLENSATSVALSQLVGPTLYLKALNPVAEEEYPTHFTQGVTITVTGVAGARTITYAP
jgi:type IV pilus assembly protein PilA